MRAGPTSRWASSGRGREYGAAIQLHGDGGRRACLWEAAFWARSHSRPTDAEKWQGYPGTIKDLGDWAFCEGINRFVFHRYALQPWTPDRAPGMSMGPWGLHYERTETWWEQSKAWHEYLARCQFLLRQGLFVADLCLLSPEGSPQTIDRQKAFLSHTPGTEGQPLDRPGHDFDGCPPEVVLTRMSVKDGRLVLPDGMSYRMLVLPRSETMTPRLLRKIKELVRAGATVVGQSAGEVAWAERLSWMRHGTEGPRL